VSTGINLKSFVFRTNPGTNGSTGLGIESLVGHRKTQAALSLVLSLGTQRKYKKFLPIPEIQSILPLFAATKKECKV
jgi:hypothetical protein